MLRWQRRWRTALEKRRDDQEEGEADAGARSLIEGGADLLGCLLSGGRGLGEVQDFNPRSGKPEEEQNFNSRLLILPRQWP